MVPEESEEGESQGRLRVTAESRSGKILQAWPPRGKRAGRERAHVSTLTLHFCP